LTKRDPRPIKSAAAKGKRRKAAEEAPVSPTQDRINVPPTLVLEPRDRQRRTADEAMVLRTRQGAVVARIDVLRPDLLPN
jgi:hypothetical protein